MTKPRRFRDVKQKKAPPKELERAQSSLAQSLAYASIGSKSKAFITDLFMLLMPIMYSVAYLMMGSLEEFSKHKAEGWFSILIPNFIIVFLFFWRSGQTPGCKAYNLRLVDNKTGSKAHPLAIALRYFFEILSIVTLAGLLLAFFRKDRKCLHDLLSGTALIEIQNTHKSS